MALFSMLSLLDFCISVTFMSEERTEFMFSFFNGLEFFLKKQKDPLSWRFC